MADQFQVATAKAIDAARLQVAMAVQAKHQEVVVAHRPSSVVVTVDDVIVATDLVLQAVQVARAIQRARRAKTVIRYRYSYVEDIIAFALKTLRENSPVGSVGDRHPGLYRDSHMVFLNGRLVSDARDWRPGDIIHISNPVPYSRKIEVGGMNLSVPIGVYESSAQIVDGRFGNQASIKFVYMPISFGGIQKWSDATGMTRPGRQMSVEVRSEWLRRQPAIEIKGR